MRASDVDDQIGVVAEDETAFTGPQHLRGVQADDRGSAASAATASNPAAASMTTASPVRERNRSQPPTSIGLPEWCDRHDRTDLPGSCVR